MEKAARKLRTPVMVNNCANPQCNKPLHYLRDGRVFVFDMASAQVGPDGKRTRHLEHYWLCGDCSPAMTLEQNGDRGILVRSRDMAGHSGSATALVS